MCLNFSEISHKNTSRAKTDRRKWVEVNQWKSKGNINNKKSPSLLAAPTAVSWVFIRAAMWPFAHDFTSNSQWGTKQSKVHEGTREVSHMYLRGLSDRMEKVWERSFNKASWWLGTVGGAGGESAASGRGYPPHTQTQSLWVDCECKQEAKGERCSTMNPMCLGWDPLSATVEVLTKHVICNENACGLRWAHVELVPPPATPGPRWIQPFGILPKPAGTSSDGLFIGQQVGRCCRQAANIDKEPG